MEKPHTFYIIYHLDKDWELVDGRRFEAGYYKFVYDLTGVERDSPCTFSKDRYKWQTFDKFKTLGEFQDCFDNFRPMPMKIEQEEYIETIHYRDRSIPIFLDDYGQCFYCIMDNKVMGFGSFQDNYEEEVKAIIDHELDRNYEKKYPQMVNTI